MKAVVYHGRRDIRVEDVPAPQCGPGELLVRVEACAVCGTDLKVFLHGNPRMKPPRVLGHEFTGRIEQVGNGVAGLAPGDRVVTATAMPCGSCYYCRRGWHYLCAESAVLGFAYDGAMAGQMLIPASTVAAGAVVRVPEGVAPEHAALAEPLSCVVNCMENCGVGRGDTVVVVGAGPMGLLNAMLARHCGAARIVISEILSRRLELARQFDFDLVVDSAQEDMAGRVMQFTGGVGADVAIVAAPEAAPQESAVRLVRKRGTVCLFASLPVEHRTLRIDSRPIHYGELRLVGTSDSSAAHLARAVQLLAAGAIPMERLITHVLPLDGIHAAFDLMATGQSLRVVLRP